MKTLYCLLFALLFCDAYSQRYWVINDSTDHILGNTHLVAGRHKLYTTSGNGLALVHDFTQQDEPEYFIRDFDFIDAQHWYVLVGSRYIGHDTRLYQTLNAGTDWQLIAPESFTVPEWLDGKAESINQIQVLDGRIYLFNGYYISNVFYSDDAGQTWTFWFESLIAQYYQMYRCGDTYYLHGLAGDAFQPYLFEIPETLLSQTNISGFYSGCHNISPGCHYPPPNSSVPEVVAHFNNVFDGLCSLKNKDVVLQHTVLFPNPVRDFFEIRTDQSILKLTLYNLMGQTVAVFQNTAHYNISDLPGGSYLATIETENSTTSVVLLKE